ncbi:CYTOCHROME P450 71B11-RELATED [Salix viminalis]|uniref:flavonoid 3',5'-hydroxylase n=1 Tax=Salix viminalis TaxID=40686 RepID=A0A6N2L3A4_SALVM|nr:CYTOCHROME P450 71B11-RELATED [Salix viminalis]
MAFNMVLLRELTVAALFFIINYLFTRYLTRKFSRQLPPGPRGWPIIGAIPLLGAMPHVTLAKMARKYGPVMYLKMGTCNMVVASTPDAARAFLKTLDLNFSNRPPNAGATHLAYNSQDMVFADHGPKWKLLRKLSNLHMLGGKALDDWAHVRVSELGHMLRAMCECSRKGEPAVVPEMLTYAMANMIGQILLSRRVFVTQGSESNEFKDMVVELMTSAGIFNIGDFIPSVAWLDLQGIERGMKKLHLKFDVLLTKMLEEHKASAHERKGKQDFLDVLLANQENVAGEKLSYTNIKALLLNLFTAGTDTSSSIIEWAMAEMMKNPHILKQAQDEMDRVIGRNRRLEESDIPKLPYLQAICKETFRKHPSTPLNLPRIADQACEVNGYYIPKGTRLSVNIWAIGRDPEVWDNPLDFTPERFFTEKYAKINPRGNDFELIPFGAGRRICAGTRMGIVLVQYILGTLVHSFDWKLPKDVELNMDEVFGLALQKAVPLAAMVHPRLEPHAYLD